MSADPSRIRGDGGRYRLLPLLGAVLLACMVAGGPVRAASAEAAVAPPRPPAVSVVRAETGTIIDSALVTGTLVARNEVLVSPEIDGLAIVELLADEGDTVVRGQVLARLARDALDTQLAQNAASIDHAAAAIAQAGAQVAEAEANRAEADAAYNRSRMLKDRGIATAEQLEQHQASARVAAARVDSARNALRLAEADKSLAEAQRRELLVRLANTRIKAPADGVISRRTARLGALASMSGDPLFRIIGDGTIELEAEVPETTLARLRVGQSATVKPAGRSRPIAARVRLVAPEVDRTTRLGRVRLSLDPVPLDPVSGLAIGAYAQGTIEIEHHQNTLVPPSAVLHGPDGAVVQLVRNGVVHTRAVKVGLNAGGKAEILEGVQPGDEVVAVSGTFVRDGDRVTPSPWCAVRDGAAGPGPGPAGAC